MSKKLNLILDIDNTLLSAEPSEDFDFSQERDKATNFKFHNMDKYYIVFERPNVQEFLDYAFRHYNVSIWTAASKDYAIYIIDNVILNGHPERKDKIDYVFYCYHCDLSVEKMEGTKDLRILWDKYKLPGYTPENTFIMDDYDEVADTNPCNCIMVDPFNYYDKDSEHDTYLKDIMEKMSRLKPGKDFLVKGRLTPDLSSLNKDDDVSTVKDVIADKAPTSMEIDLNDDDMSLSSASSSASSSVSSSASSSTSSE